MSFLRRLGSALALVWQIIRLSLPEKLNRTHVGAFVLVGVLGTTVAVFYATSPRPLKISAYDPGATAAPETPKAPAAKEPGPVAPTGTVIDPSRLGSRFPYPSPEKSPFEVARPGLAAQTPDQGRAKPSVVTQAEKAPSPGPTTSEIPRGHPYREAIKKLLYAPIVTFGDLKARHRIAYLWSAQSPNSWKIFRDVIEPFTRKPNRYSVVLIQSFIAVNARSSDPGSLLLCPNDRIDYATLAYNFLVYSRDLAPVRPVGDFNGTTFNTDMNIEKAFRTTKIDAPNAKCIDNIVFQSRNLIFLRNSIKFQRDFSLSNFPALLVDGVPVENITEQNIRSRLR